MWPCLATVAVVLGPVASRARERARQPLTLTYHTKNVTDRERLVRLGDGESRREQYMGVCILHAGNFIRLLLYSTANTNNNQRIPSYGTYIGILFRFYPPL